MSNGYTSKCSGPYWSNQPFLIFFDILTERQSARIMSTNYKGSVRPVWRWTLWQTHFATIRKSVRLKGLNYWTVLFAGLSFGGPSVLVIQHARAVERRVQFISISCPFIALPASHASPARTREKNAQRTFIIRNSMSAPLIPYIVQTATVGL